MVKPALQHGLESIRLQFYKLNQRAKTYNASHIHEIVLKKPSKYCSTEKIFLGAVLMTCIDGDDNTFSYLLFGRLSGKFLGRINLPKDDPCYHLNKHMFMPLLDAMDGVMWICCCDENTNRGVFNTYRYSWSSGNISLWDRMSLGSFLKCGLHLINGGDVASYKVSTRNWSCLNVLLYRRANEYKAVTHSIYLGKGKTVVGGGWNRQPRIDICNVGPKPIEYVGLRFSCFSNQPIVKVKSSEKVSVDIGCEHFKKHSEFEIDKDLDLVERVIVKTPKGKSPKKNEMTSARIFTLLD